MTDMENPRVIGNVVAVHGFRVKVELLPETRSPLRATLDGVQLAVAINSYLSFSIGVGRVAIGMITDLEARESYNPADGDDLTLELIKPRRVAIVQLLGAVEEGIFNAAITILPTLDTLAEICTPEILKAVFESPPQWNKPEYHNGNDFDCDLRIGSPTGQPSTAVRASYNDLFSRPLAIVGNTGSGKSFTVSSLIQKAMKALSGEAREEPHIFVLDINGEYGKAFPPKAGVSERRPNCIYLNGSEFGIPLWFFNAEEICSWLSAAEQTQEPVLKDWWSIAKGGTSTQTASVNRLKNALSSIDQLLTDLVKLKRKSAGSYCDAICSHLDGSDIDYSALKELFVEHRNVNDFNNEVLDNQADIIDAANSLQTTIKSQIVASSTTDEQGIRTSDTPMFIPRQILTDPSLINRAVSKEDTFRIEAHLTTLKLRLKTRLDDRRWRAFLNYEDPEIDIQELASWFARFGVGNEIGPKVSVLDLSMLSNEVLPYACSVIGRILLEARECLPATRRFKHPWVLVLEEAHNYARPGRLDEDRGHKLARLAFERVAKEGRKFGMSLIIASQRPSEISPTIISQCANFVSHRLQNPDDIDHFRRIIPIQARRLLDQVTILASGEAIVFGSAFHVPARVRFDMPSPVPYSQTAAPFLEWSKEKISFPLDEIISVWGIPPHNANQMQTDPSDEIEIGELTPPADSELDDEFPF